MERLIFLKKMLWLLLLVRKLFIVAWHFVKSCFVRSDCTTVDWRDGAVVEAFASQSVDLGLNSLVKSY